MNEPRFVIITGLSGAGKSQAMNALEDLGFHCVDNLPPVLIPAFLEVMQRSHIDRIAIALDVMSGGPSGEADDALAALDRAGVHYDMLFLEADDDVLVRRYSETRRKHPLANNGRVFDSIAAERHALAPLRERAGRVWDTSHLLASGLKERIAGTFSCDAADVRLRIVLLAFGYKYGLPMDSDLVFDVRFLPNPNYVPELQPLTGADPAVEAFMERHQAAAEFLNHLYPFIDYAIPQFIAEGKTRLTIAIGCTGGRHRSVYVARRLLAHISGRQGIAPSLVTRDVE